MIQTIFRRLGIFLAAGCVLAGVSVHAQPQGGVGGFGGQATQRTSTSRNSNYPSSTDIGQARITYDAETRSIIIVADEDTATHIKDVVSQLDRPAPQVLIKCVFMEATYSKGTDIGVDGTYTHSVSSKSVNEFNGSGAASTAFDLATSGGMYHLLGQNLDV